METNEMEERQKIRNRIAIASLAVLAVMIFACYLLKKKGIITSAMTMWVLTSFLAFYWIVNDLVEPVLAAGKDTIKKAAGQYLKFALVDLVGDIALVYFIYNIGGSDEGAIAGAVIYLLCLNLGKREKNRFYEEAKAE